MTIDPFYFRGRALSTTTHQLRMLNPLVGPPGAGMIACLRMASNAGTRLLSFHSNTDGNYVSYRRNATTGAMGISKWNGTANGTAVNNEVPGPIPLGEPCVYWAYTLSTTQSWFGVGNGGNSVLDTFAALPTFTTNRFSVGAFDTLNGLNGQLDGTIYWLGLLRLLPPFELLQSVVRQVAPPTILIPWLAHLIPFQGRDAERCILTGNTMAAVSDVPPVSTFGTMQPQVRRSSLISSGAKWVARLRVSSGDTWTELTKDIGEPGRVGEVTIKIPAEGGTTIGIATNGSAFTETTMAGGANVQSGDLLLGTSMISGVPATEAGRLAVAGMAISSTSTDANRTTMQALTQTLFRPGVNNVALVSPVGVEVVVDLASYVTSDPAASGYSFQLTGFPAAVTALLNGSVLTISANAAGTFNGSLKVISNHPLAFNRTAAMTLNATSTITRYTNGYRWRQRIDLPAWRSAGSEANFILFYQELNDVFKTTANGGMSESNGNDVVFETSGGTKLGHVRVGIYEPTIGAMVAAVNLSRTYTNLEFIYVYVGKPGVTTTEEDPVLARTGSYLALHNGFDDTDWFGNGRNFTSTTAVTLRRDGPHRAGFYNGTTSVKSRTSSELDGLAAMSFVIAGRGDEAPGRAMEMANIATDTTVYWACRWMGIGSPLWQLMVGTTSSSVQTQDTGVYQANQMLSFGGGWGSGGSQFIAASGTRRDLTASSVLTGAIDANETLELGGGGRAAADTRFSGAITLFMLVGRRLADAVMEQYTACLENPRWLYGVNDFITIDQQEGITAMPLSSDAISGGAAVLVDVVAVARNPNNMPITLTVGTPTFGDASVSNGRLRFQAAAGTGGRTALIPYTLSSGTYESTGLLRIVVRAQVIVEPPPTEGLPSGVGIPAFPTFAGARTINVNSASGLTSAISSSQAGENLLILCAPGVDYGDFLLRRPATHRIKIQATTPVLTGLDTTQRTTYRNNSATDTNAQDQIVRGLISDASAARIGLDIRQIGLIVVEGFRVSGGRRIEVNVSGGAADTCGEVWIKNCRFGHTTGHLLTGGGSSTAGFRRLISWNNFFWADARIVGGGAASNNADTDYGLRIYESGRGAGNGVWVHNCLFVGGYNHMVSMKESCGRLNVTDTVFVHWSTIGANARAMRIGQEGGSSSADRTCDFATVRGCTFVDKLQVLSSPNFAGVVIQDTVGSLIEDNLFMYQTGGGQYPFSVTPGTNSGQGGGFPPDLGVKAGSQGIIIRGNRFLYRATPGLRRMYYNGEGGYTITFENNDVPAGGPIPVRDKEPGVTTRHLTNSGFSG